MEVSECYITFVCASNIDEKVFFSGAFRKPLINEMAAAGLHLYPHAAISDIRYAEEEWDRNHLSDKCSYLCCGPNCDSSLSRVIYD